MFVLNIEDNCLGDQTQAKPPCILICNPFLRLLLFQALALRFLAFYLFFPLFFPLLCLLLLEPIGYVDEKVRQVSELLELQKSCVGKGLAVILTVQHPLPLCFGESGETFFHCPPQEHLATLLVTLISFTFISCRLVAFRLSPWRKLSSEGSLALMRAERKAFSIRLKVSPSQNHSGWNRSF